MITDNKSSKNQSKPGPKMPTLFTSTQSFIYTFDKDESDDSDDNDESDNKTDEDGNHSCMMMTVTSEILSQFLKGESDPRRQITAESRVNVFE